MTEVSFADIMDAFFAPPKPQAEPPYIKDGVLLAPYVDEVSLRRNLAGIAEAYGWTVQQEVVVPGWGRIDLVLHEPENPDPWLIELKLELLKPAKVRRAFQQADGYGRWWANNKGSASRSYLVGVKHDLDIVTKVHGVYPEVGFLSGPAFMKALAHWGDPRKRLDIANSRLSDVRRQLSVHEQVTATLAAYAAIRDQSP